MVASGSFACTTARITGLGSNADVREIQLRPWVSVVIGPPPSSSGSTANDSSIDRRSVVLGTIAIWIEVSPPAAIAASSSGRALGSALRMRARPAGVPATTAPRIVSLAGHRKGFLRMPPERTAAIALPSAPSTSGTTAAGRPGMSAGSNNRNRSFAPAAFSAATELSMALVPASQIVFVGQLAEDAAEEGLGVPFRQVDMDDDGRLPRRETGQWPWPACWRPVLLSARRR